MEFKKSITILSIFIAVLSFVACAYGVFSYEGPGSYEYVSIHGEKVQLYGRGLYQKDSLSAAAQGISQDIVTMILGISLLLISLYIYRRGSLKGRLLLTGTLGYFLYTYSSYCFVWIYNSFFLVYVAIMSASFFAFVLAMMSFDIPNLGSCFSEKLPVKRLGGFLVFFGILLGMLWLGRIVPPLINGTLPIGLEHYATLVIQALDLGFVVPIAIVSGILVLKRKAFGYLLSSVICIKSITLASAVTAMLIGQLLAGIEVSLAELLIFPIVNLGIIYCIFLILKNIREPKSGLIKTVGIVLEKEKI